MSELLERFINALTYEIDAIRKNGGETRILLRGGECIGKAEDKWLYHFVLSEDLNLRDDTPVQVISGKEKVVGIVVSYRNGVLTVALESNLGPRIAEARLVVDDSFLLERLKERLEKVQNRESNLNQEMADRVLGLLPISSEESNPHASVLSDGMANEDQVRAIRRSLGSNVTFIWGPPGTGKTTTIARIVEAHYRSGRSVLLVSNTNIAVDMALEHVAKRLNGETDFHQGLVIRQGPVVKEELRQLYGPQVILEEIIKRLGRKLQDEKDQILHEVKTLETENRDLNLAIKNIELLDSANQALANRKKAYEIEKEKLASSEKDAVRYQYQAAKARSDLERAQCMGTVRRFFSGLNPERLTREILEADNAAKAATDSAKAIASSFTMFQDEIASLRRDVDRLLTKTQKYKPLDQIKSRLVMINTRLAQIRDRISEIKRELAELEIQVIARCKILATTVYRTYLGKSGMRQFDTLVIDEASMLMLPLVYYTAGLATQSVTVAGDFRQLPPIVVSEEALAVEWLKCDIFEKAGITAKLDLRQPIPYLVALSIQYRMHESICKVINKLFYFDHPLRSNANVNCRETRFPIAESPLLYVNTASYQPWAAFRIGTFSRYNLFHALLVRNIVSHIAGTGFLPNIGEPNDAIGVVTPYASQARLIQALLDDRVGPRATGVAATVHRYQGNEKMAMILDLPDSYGVRLSRFLKAKNIREDGARLLNVAASRAKQHLILVGNFDYLQDKAPADGFVRGLIDHFGNHGEKINLENFLPLAEQDWMDGLFRIMPTTFDLPEGDVGAFSEGTFYPAFFKDLAEVCESIVIFSPFVTKRGTSRWIDSFRAALTRGVKIRILTRPPHEFGGCTTKEVAELVHALRNLGITIDLRSKMHEKIAILDGRILWNGSLNILSHSDTYESMLRLDSKSLCQMLRRYVSTPTGRRGNDSNPFLDSPENPPCPKCGKPTVWNTGRYGIFFKCEDADCDGKVDPLRAGNQTRIDTNRSNNRRSNITQDSNDVSKLCPKDGCNGRLVERKGKFGLFLGCTNFPKCRHTENLK